MEKTFSEVYRNKLRNRLKSAQIRAKQKISSEDVLESQEIQLKRDIESRLSSRSEWKRSISHEFNTDFIENDISSEKSFEFFFGTDISNDSKDNINEAKAQTSGEEVIEIEGQDNSRDTRILIKDMFNSTNNWNIYERNKTKIKLRKDMIKDEKKFLYIPSDKTIEDSNEDLIKEEIICFNKINGFLSIKNLNKIKHRIISEGLKNQFLQNDSLFIENQDKIELKHCLQIDPEFGSDKQLICESKPNFVSLKQIFNNWFKKSENLLITETNGSKNRNDRKLLENIESLNSDQLNELVLRLRNRDNDNTSNGQQLEVNDNTNTINKSLANYSPKELEFTTDEEIEKNPRFRLLQLRWKGVSNFKYFRFVPINEKEIPLDLFETKPKPKISLNTKRHFEEKREKAIEMLTKVGQQLVQQSSGTSDRPRTLEDMVIEEEVPGISAIGFTLFPVAHNKRPLNPYRRERKKIAFNLISNSDIKIVITIMHANNVPVRKQDNITNVYANGDNGFTYECKVCPFVETVFQRQSARTNTAEGVKPTWNETLSLKLKVPENDCLPSNLSKINDCIYFNLFDEVLLNSDETITSDGQKITHKRSERRWLGSLRIPFSTLYLNSKIEGTFSLSTPLMLFGYEYDTKGLLLGADNTTKDTSKQTYLTLFVTIDPSLQLPEPLVIKCDTIESESLLIYSKKWQNKLKEEFPERNIKALAVNMSANSVLVCKYLRPLKPPEEFLTNFNVTNDIMQRLARFVALIPKVPDSISLPGVCDIWCTCDQLLEMLLGDEEEHAILLCNYFLYLDKRAAILLGYGIPEGMTAYVIVFEYLRDPYVFNTSTGEQFNVRDSYLPLNSIGCIITPENIFANVSKSEHPSRLNYDLNKTSDWKPFFGKPYPMPPIVSIQPESLVYTSSDFDNALKLQETLEKHLRESFMRWRKRSRTFFNRHVIQSIKKILPRLESAGKVQINDLIQELHDVVVLHEMTGFPLNMPYTDFDSITEAVFATGVHLAEDKRVEFALAVYVHPYPCSILSVWVYVAALTRHSEL